MISKTKVWIFLGIPLISGLIMSVISTFSQNTPLKPFVSEIGASQVSAELNSQSVSGVIKSNGLKEIIMIENNSLAYFASPINSRESILWEIAQKYEYSYDVLYALWNAETTLRHEDIWGNEGEYGAFQWKLKSFKDYSKKFALELNIFDFKDQAILTTLTLKEPDGWKNWRNSFNNDKILRTLKVEYNIN